TNFYFSGFAEDRLFELQREVNAQIVASLRASPSTSSTTAGTEDVAEEVPEDLIEVDRLESAGEARAVDGGMAEAIVGGALVGIGEHGVGLARFFEFFFSLRLARIT